MRPQGFGQVGASLDDLGWDDMGFEPPKPAEPPVRDAEHDAFGEVVAAHPHKLAGLTPVESPVHDQQAEIAGRLSAFTPEDSGEDEVDETAELYDPEAEPKQAGEPTVKAAPAPVAKTGNALAAKAAPAPVARSANVPAARRPVRSRAEPGTKGKAAFTLRLDPARHLKLRLACAVSGRSAQLLVTQALDDFLASMPELDSMAEKAKPKGSSR